MEAFAIIGVMIVVTIVGLIYCWIKESNAKTAQINCAREILSIYKKAKYLPDRECDVSYYHSFGISEFNSRIFIEKFIGYSTCDIRKAVENKSVLIYSPQFSKETQERLKVLWLQLANSIDKEKKYRDAAEPSAPKSKSAKSKVIKGAVVGGIIGGETGAIVGAMAAKAEQDAKK